MTKINSLLLIIFSTQDKLPSEKALTAAQNLLDCGVALGALDDRYKLLGQRQVIATESPGLRLYQEIQNWPHWKSKA